MHKKIKAVEFVGADDDYYTYKLNGVIFRVPYEKVEDMYEEDIYDSYLLFDKLELLN